MTAFAASYEVHLQRRFPFIPWREPLPVTVAGAPPRLACRFCVALNGLDAREVPLLPATRQEFNAHMAREHPHPL